ncbi:hypothetical protein GEU84_003535 [Fertoebacter nigrum]|uniref:Uncharacterized protein n=1 Tax=Fertoeibacter niger TaxID=2656921 RepID=A0A8X8KJQ0_9RHOB|nr:hypothetical protein [Fertoeibacter niger]NUB43444.1 hypothetical protein [Fertoeibacter niger]
MTADLASPAPFAAVMPRWRQRRRLLGLAQGEALPAITADLAALARQRVPVTIAPLPRPASGHARKQHELMVEFAGQSELALLNGLLVAHLRKRRQPAHAARLFQRIWAEQGVLLRGELSARWLISSVVTFADHGVTERQRRIGQSLNMLFGLIKLYETERLYSGLAPDRPFQRRRPSTAPLPLDLAKYSLRDGGIEVNLLAPLWVLAQRDAVAGPLACHLLERLAADPAGLFHRLALMRAARAEWHAPAPPRGSNLDPPANIL